jgi:AcrR family transcriptional regulator
MALVEARTERAPARARAQHLGPERRRPLVLDAALRLVARQGASATTMDAIAAEAGVTKPVVYACYPSKHELMKALLRREERRLADHMSGSLPEHGDVDDVEAALAEGFRAFLAAVAAEPDSYRVIFMTELGSYQAVQRSVERARRGQTERIAGLVAAGMRSRGVDQVEAKALVVASVVMGASEAAVKLLLSDPDGWPPDELADLLAQLMVRGMAGLGLT